MGHRDYICNFEECVSPGLAKGWCNAHYKQWKSGKEMKPTRQRLARGSVVEVLRLGAVEGDQCLEWPGGKHSAGYGLAGKGVADGLAHRASWEINVGPIPEGMEVLHSCDNPPCYRISHLEVNTHAKNMGDAKLRDRFPHTPRAQGEKHSQSKLTAFEAREIYALKAIGESTKKLQAEFGVSKYAINGIYSGKLWGSETQDLQEAL